MRYIIKSSLIVLDHDGQQLSEVAAYCSAYSIASKEEAHGILDALSPIQDNLIEEEVAAELLEPYNPDELE